MTIIQALQWGEKKIKKISTSAILDTEVLLAWVVKKDKQFLYLNPQQKLTNAQIKNFQKKIWQRATGVPVAYLLESKEFYNLNFLVNKNVLIPRPETELLIEEALQQIKQISKNKKLFLIDVGTGSGCIPIVIAKNITTHNLKILGLDVSLKALKVAKTNAQNHQAQITFLKSNLLTVLEKKLQKKSHDHLLITANLPYLTTNQLKEKSIKKEPRLALYGGKDGLEVYQKLLQQIKKINSTSLTVFLEIDPTQNKKIITLIKKFLPDTQVEIKKDLANQERLVIIKTEALLPPKLLQD